MTFICYAGSKFWHQIQTVISLSYTKSSQKLLKNDKLKSQSKLLQNNALIFLSIFKETILAQMRCNKRRKKCIINISN